ncbi:MAG: PilZ domain-containing protein [Holophaga sp.]|nr:PilZ domain-containing protein [Holophaga sp.]
MENRHCTRVLVEPQCKAQFQLGGQTYNNITVSNLGEDGCCLSGSQSLGTLTDSAILEDWQLIHPALPKGSIKAKVVWVNRERQGSNTIIHTGVKFQDAPSGYVKRLGKFVDTMASH